MTTDLSTLTPPDELSAWVRTADPATEIFNHSITVNLTWWNAGLVARQLDGGPVSGRTAAGDSTTSGRGAISRGDLFELAPAASRNSVAALTLLWHTLAWGAGSKVRKNYQRMEAIRTDPAAGQALAEAARLAQSDPAAAYDSLRPNGKSRIAHLGPAFFTKYLYFAGGPSPENPCLILDRVVASALAARGWTSLRTSAWPTATYSRYLDLISCWRAAVGDTGPAVGSELPRCDLFEKYLFTH